MLLLAFPCLPCVCRKSQENLKCPSTFAIHSIHHLLPNQINWFSFLSDKLSIINERSVFIQLGSLCN